MDESQDAGMMLSPVRPQRPDEPRAEAPIEDAETTVMPEEVLPQNPEAALEYIRAKMEKVSAEFSEGKINRAQFSAIYKHYSDKRAIIEQLNQRNPANEAWKQVAAPGHTTFLRGHFEARPVFYVVFLHKNPKPLTSGGKVNSMMVTQIARLLRTMWSSPNLPGAGLARKPLEDNQWLVLALGRFGITFAVFTLQPSDTQANLVRDLHSDFERANRMFIERGQIWPERMVFPQRALLQQVAGDTI
jgi:hypothetical protein